jgi:hypothetical protein
MERIFEAGFREFVKLRKQTGTNLAVLMDGARRAMRATYQREMDHLERHLAFLASTGSVSPYVGLFGTVWGIMHSFRSLANVQQATLAQVAPGIAEALVATAIGLFAASRPSSPSATVRHIERLDPLRNASWKSSPTAHRNDRPRRGAAAGVGPAQVGNRNLTAHAPPPAPDEPDQRRALRRRDAGAAGDLRVRAAGESRVIGCRPPEGVGAAPSADRRVPRNERCPISIATATRKAVEGPR